MTDGVILPVQDVARPSTYFTGFPISDIVILPSPGSVILAVKLVVGVILSVFSFGVPTGVCVCHSGVIKVEWGIVTCLIFFRGGNRRRGGVL